METKDLRESEPPSAQRPTSSWLGAPVASPATPCPATHPSGPWHRLPAGPLPHPGRCIPLNRCTTCPSSNQQHPVPCTPLSQHLAEFALNLFICGVLFNASLLRNTDSVFIKSFLSEHITLNFKALVPKQEESQFRRERLQITSEIYEECKSQETFGGT